MKKISLFILIIFTVLESFSQCTVVSSNGYTVNIEIQLDSIERGNDQCPGPGYNYDVALTYNVTFTGPNQPSNLYTLQGNVNCGASSLFFNMNNSGGNTSVKTGGNAWNGDCSKTSLSDLGCNSSTISISGPGISYQSFECTPTVLPVDLTSFLSKTFEDRIELDWKTASEINNDYFIVERLVDNRWDAIGQVTGNGTTNEVHYYSYIDQEVDVTEVAYYRLRQIDFDGKADISHIIQSDVIKTQGHVYKFHQNGAKITLSFLDDHNEYTKIQVLSETGSVLFEEDFLSVQNEQSLTFDLSEYKSGWYVIGIIGVDNAHFEKMILVK
ncbi:MAG: hypothetical protein ACPGEG_09775 [Salibacteraceae bacterium]